MKTKPVNPAVTCFSGRITTGSLGRDKVPEKHANPVGPFALRSPCAQNQGYLTAFTRKLIDVLSEQITANATFFLYEACCYGVGEGLHIEVRCME